MDPTDSPSAETRICKFCFERVNIDDPETYHEVKSWVNGPKLDGPKLREQTGRYAHKSCIDLLVAGQAPDQERLFDPIEDIKAATTLIDEEDDGDTPDTEPYDPSKNYDF